MGLWAMGYGLWGHSFGSRGEKVKLQREPAEENLENPWKKARHGSFERSVTSSHRQIVTLSMAMFQQCDFSLFRSSVFSPSSPLRWVRWVLWRLQPRPQPPDHLDYHYARIIKLAPSPGLGPGSRDMNHAYCEPGWYLTQVT